MNYDQARQLGQESDAAGKWNWTSMNDGVVRTAPPCAYPDYEWPERFDPLNPPMPTGRLRCDHDTQEEAERHHWRSEMGHARLTEIDLDTADEQHRCQAKPGPRIPHQTKPPDAPCREWASYVITLPGIAGVQFYVCAAHTTQLPNLYPFTPGLQVIHS
jgi:hypothetical protein